KIPGHSIQMCEAAKSEKGLAAIGLGAKVLAFTAMDLFDDPELLAKVKEDHRWHVEHQKELPL
ncbi:MAG: amidohydrolase, partial [Firmicutes bacterium]|nr:amidohydrolase [Bacillota bacterium]